MLSLLEGKPALRPKVAFYDIFRLPIHFAVKMASSSGVGVVCRRRLAAGGGYEVDSRRGIHCTALASRYLLTPLRPRQALAQSGIAEVSRVGVLRPLQPPAAVRGAFVLYRCRGRRAGDDVVSLGVRHD